MSSSFEVATQEGRYRCWGNMSLNRSRIDEESQKELESGENDEAGHRNPCTMGPS